MGFNIVNHRSNINIEISNIKINYNNKKIYHFEAKLEVEKCIDFICKDFKTLRTYIINLFIKSNEILINS